MRIFSVFAICFLIFLTIPPTPNFAQPQIDNASGTIIDKANLTITGSVFGTKSTAPPLFFDNFDSNDSGRQNGNQIKGNNASNYGSWLDTYTDTIPIYTNTNQRSGSTLSSLNYMICANTEANHAPMFASFSETHQSTVLVSFWMHFNWDSMTGAGNIKIFRINDGVGEQDIYTSLQMGQSNGQPMTNGFFEIFLQSTIEYGIWPVTSDTTLNFNFLKGTWQQYIVMLKASTDDIADGSVIIIQDGTSLENTSLMETWDSTDSWQQATFGWYCANYTDGNIYLQFDDIYIDNTWQSVWIGDTSIWNSCTHREIQIPTAWSNNTVTITFNQGSFNNGDTVYLYVVDENGFASEGYPITIGGTTIPSVGDINSDGKVDTVDIQACVNHILGAQDYGIKADVNGDNKADILDVQIILNKILGN